MQLVQRKISRWCCLLIVAGFALPAQAQNEHRDNNSFTLEGSLNGMTIMPRKMYLIYDSLNSQPADSSVMKNGKYTFKGKIDNPSLVYLSPKLFNNRSKEAATIARSEYAATIYLDKGRLTAVSNKTIDNVTVTGSPAHTDFKAATRQNELLWKDTVMGIATLYKETKNRAYFDMLMLSGPLMEKTERDGHWDFMQKHPASPINVYLICRDLAMGTSPEGYVDSLTIFYDHLPANIKASPMGLTAAGLLERKQQSLQANNKAD